MTFLYVSACVIIVTVVCILALAAKEVIVEELDEDDRLEYERTGKVTKRMKRNKRRHK